MSETSTSEGSSRAATTIVPGEVAQFASQARDWWDPDGPEAMLHKLNPVRLKYIRDFSEAFRDYRRALTDNEFKQQCATADVLLVGDYHALAASQDFAASFVGQLAQSDRPVVLALEMAFSRDQYVLDEWLHGEISEDELRAGIRYDAEWGYDWEPFARLLRQARQYGCPVYGIDLKPRGNMRKISARDRHAATQIAQIRRAHPGAQVLTLIGEAHLAPQHLPHWLHLLRPRDRVLTVLQNLDELYWKAAGELSDSIHGVQVSEDVLCVFNATPLEKELRLILPRHSVGGKPQRNKVTRARNFIAA